MKYILYIILFMWQFPQALFALIASFFVGEKKFVSSENFCLVFSCPKLKATKSFGCVAFLPSNIAGKTAYIMHEQYGHCSESKMFGPLYLFVFGIPAFIHSLCNVKDDKYYSFYTEKMANKYANLEILKTNSGRYFLSPKNILTNNKI